MWVGTMVRTPFDRIAGLNEPEAVCPFMAGSVSVISSVTFCGISSEIAMPSWMAKLDLHAFLQIGGHVADDIRLQRDLVVGLVVHEMEAVAVLIEVGIFHFLDMGAFDLIGGLVAHLGLHAVGNPAHIDLGGGGALAGMKTFRVEDDIELAVDIDDIAFAELTSDDLHENYP